MPWVNYLKCRLGLLATEDYSVATVARATKGEQEFLHRFKRCSPNTQVVTRYPREPWSSMLKFFFPRVDRVTKLKSDSSRFEYRMLQFQTRLGKMKKRSHHMLWWWFSRAFFETVVGIKWCGVWSLFNRAPGMQWSPGSGGDDGAIFEDKVLWNFPVASVCGRLFTVLWQNVLTL